MKASSDSGDSSHRKDYQLSKQGDILAKLQATVSFREDHSLASIVTFASRNSYPVHRWFRFREGFSPELVRMFLLNEDHSTVLDPFCGSGTTLVEASNFGISSYGVEINPLSHFVSLVKTIDYSEVDLQSLQRLSDDVLHVTLADRSSPVPRLRIMGKAFDPEILEALLTFKKAILEVAPEKHMRFLLLGWLSILESVSNTYKEGNGIKYRFRKRTPTGYVELPRDAWQLSFFGPNRFEHVRSRLRMQYDEMLADVQVRLSQQRGPCSVFCETVNHLDRLVPPNSISVSIFSPPYANCFDYFEIFKIELWMGGFVESYPELRKRRNKSLRSHTNADLTRPIRFQIPELEELLGLMDEGRVWDRRIPQMIQGYFDDMHDALVRIFTALKPGGACAIVVGNSAYGKVVIPTDLLLAHTGLDVGFVEPRVTSARHLTTSSQQKKHLEPLKGFLRESFVLLRKP